jgi:hypothetical protein
MIVWLAVALTFLIVLLGIADARRRRRARDEESAPVPVVPTPPGSLPAAAKPRRARLRRRLPS